MTLQSTFSGMLAELQSGFPEVVLVPSARREEAERGAMVRLAVGFNAYWYRKFCAKFPSARRRRNAAFDTCIKRANVTRVLARLSRGLPSRSPYISDLLAASADADPAYLPSDDDVVPF